MKGLAKGWLARISSTKPVQVVVDYVIYPRIVRGLMAECQPDEDSPSGLVEQLSWKIHSAQVLRSELALGVNCCPGRMDSNRGTRQRIFEVVSPRIEVVSGDILEFGVAAGESFLWFLRRFPDRHVYGFDSFEGLPEDWWTRPKGTFKAEPPRFTEPNGTLVRGWFEESMPEFFRDFRKSVALLHVDCDIYSASIYAMRQAIPYCHAGTIVLFDEYYNYPGFASHEWLAWWQLRKEYDVEAECIAYDGRRAAFQIASLRRVYDNSPQGSKPGQRSSESAL
jgi:hypothetical protein